MTQTKAELLETKHQGDIRLGDANSSHYVGFKAPATVSSSLVWTLPAADGSANQFLKTNASGVLSWGTVDTSTLMPLGGGTFTGNVTYNDNLEARFGTGADFKIYHRSSDESAVIKNANDTGFLRILSGDTDSSGILIKNANDDVTYLRAKNHDGVELFFNDVKKFETTSSGAKVTGELQMGGTAGVKFSHSSQSSIYESQTAGDELLFKTTPSGGSSTTALTISSTQVATFAGNAIVTGDLTVSGTTTTINTQTLDVEDKNVVIGKVSNPSDTTADGGGWTLKGASDKTFNWVNATDAWTSSEHIHLGDDKKFIVGTGSDLSIYHDSTNSYISNITGVLRVRSDDLRLQSSTGEEYFYGTANGGAHLYHDNALKLQTTSSGVTVSGTVTATSFSGSGANLTGLPASAGEFTATASGSLTAGQAVIINSSGQLKKPAKTVVAKSPPDIAGFSDAFKQNSGTAYNPKGYWDPVNKVGIHLYVWTSNNNGSGAVGYLTPYLMGGTSDPLKTVPGTDYNIASSGYPMYAICVGQPTSTTSRFLIYFRESNNYMKVRCYDTDGETATGIGSAVAMGWGGSGYQTYGRPWGICKTGTALQYCTAFLNDSDNSMELELVTVDANGNCTRGNGIGTTSSNQGGMGDKVSSVCYDPNSDRILTIWMDENSPYYHQWQIYQESSGSLTLRGSGNFGKRGYSGRHHLSYDDASGKFCFVYNNVTNDDQDVIIGTINTTSLSYTRNTINSSANYTDQLGGCIEGTSGRFVMSYYDGSRTKIRSAPISGNSVGTFTSAADMPQYFSYNFQEMHNFVQIPHLSQMNPVMTQYNTSYSQRRSFSIGWKFTTVTTDLTTTNYIGIAKTTGSGSRTINTIGAVNENVSGLTAGTKYYAQSDGTLAASADGIAGAVPVGTALAANKLLLKH